MANSRRENGSGSIFKRKDGIWQATFTVGRKTGKLKRQTLYAKTQKEAREKLRAAIAEVDAGVYTTPANISLEAWLIRYLNEETANLAPYTKSGYESIIYQRIIPALGRVKLDKLTHIEVQDFANALYRAKKDGGYGLSPKRAQNIMSVLRRALNVALKIGLIKSNPASCITLPKIEHKEIKPLLDDEIVMFLEAVKGDAYERIHVLGLFTGMREGEVLGLTWDSIDWNASEININKQLQQHQKKGDFSYYLKSPKHEKRRKIIVASEIMHLLREQRAAQDQAKSLCGELWNNEFDLVFTNELGNPINRRTILKHLKKCLSNKGLSNQTFHGLRHGFATMSIQNGVDPKTLQEHLGHHDPGFTLKQYCFASDKMKRDSAEKMQNRMEEIMGKSKEKHMTNDSSVVVVAVVENEERSNVIKFPRNKEKRNFINR